VTDAKADGPGSTVTGALVAEAAGRIVVDGRRLAF